MKKQQEIIQAIMNMIRIFTSFVVFYLPDISFFPVFANEYSLQGPIDSSNWSMTLFYTQCIMYVKPRSNVIYGIKKLRERKLVRNNYHKYLSRPRA